MKHLSSLLILFISLGAFAQEKIKNDSVVIIPHSIFFDSYRYPTGIGDTPAFSIGHYVFYPEKEMIGRYNYWISPMSSSGMGHYYVDTLRGADYATFEIVDFEKMLAKDKNRTYPFLPEPNGYLVMDKDRHGYMRTMKEDSIYVYSSGIKGYKVDEIMSDIAFKRNDSLFIYTGREYIHFSENRLNPYTLKYIEGNIYQDDKNLYRIYNDKIETIEDEQIISKHTFVAYEAEARNMENGNNNILIGKRNFYGRSWKLFNKELQSFHFLPDSYHYFFNDVLYFFRYNSSSQFPVGISSMSSTNFSVFLDGDYDEGFPYRDYKKARSLSNDVLVYDNRELFYESDRIAYPAYMNLSRIEYVGQFPYRMDINLIADEKSIRCKNNSPIFRYENKNYIICEKNLFSLKKIEDRNNKDYKDFNLDGLHFYNEYYFTDGNKLYCNEDIRQYVRVDYDKPIPYLSAKNIDLKNLKVCDRYFSDGKTLYYDYKPIRDAMNIKYTRQYGRPSRFFKHRDEIEYKKLKKVRNLSILNFDKLKLIEGTEYLTDENYLIYKDYLVGKIDYKTLKVLGKDFLEDATQYFNCTNSVKKDVLKIKINTSKTYSDGLPNTQ